MSLITFYKHPSHNGDQFEFKITGENQMYLFHLTNNNELINDYLLDGTTDKEKIENGLDRIGDFLGNLSAHYSATAEILSKLERVRANSR